ncbi:MAG: hypothetical protein ACREFP_13170 [Acetobacteraceae bacterium]
MRGNAKDKLTLLTIAAVSCVLFAAPEGRAAQPATRERGGTLVFARTADIVTLDPT